MLIDTGATMMSLPSDVAMALITSGDAEFGPKESFRLADRSIREEWTIIIRRMTIGSHALTNVSASVAPTGATPLLSPAAWGRIAVQAYRDFEADRIIAETNFGGAMVEHVIKTEDPLVPFEEVKASRGKVARAEPVAALYEQGRVRHVRSLLELEDQLVAFTPDGYVGSGSPDRADALIWALTDLMLTGSNFDDTYDWVGAPEELRAFASGTIWRR
jgi:hypothetical protein